MKLNLLLTVLLGVIMLSANDVPTNTYPQDYFRSPVGGTIRLSGTFGELRSNHFHSGIDIKPQRAGAVGEPLYAIADGYVKRIKVSAAGYGNALYIEHPNGYTSVYAHLHRYTNEMADFVKNIQYQNKSFAFDIDTLTATQLPVKKGDIVGYMGTSGYSFGSHLHFEIRDTKTERPINPLLFGLKVRDDVPPRLHEFIVYDLNDKKEQLHREIYKINQLKSGKYSTQDTVVVQSSRVGVGLKVYDHFAGVHNWNGVYAINMYVDDSLAFRFEAEKLDFSERRYLNAHIDYAERVKHKSFFNRCFILPGNKNTTIYKKADNQGIIDLKNDGTAKIRLVAEDLDGNQSSIDFVLKRKGNAPVPQARFNYILPYNEPSIIKRNDLHLEFKPFSFYETVYLKTDYSEEKSDGFYSGVHHIHNNTVPVHTPYKLAIRPARLPDSLKTKAFVALCDDSEDIDAFQSTWEEGFLVAYPRTFGDFCIMIDTIPPTVIPRNMSTILNIGSTLSFTIKDEISGINEYRGMIDGDWVLFEYDAKNDRLFHRFDGRIPTGEHKLSLVVTDQVGNETIYDATFTLR